MLYKDFPQAFYNLFFFFALLYARVHQHPASPFMSLLLDFQQFGYDDPGYVHFFVLSYLCFNLLGSIIWHSYLWLLSLRYFFWTVCSLRHNTSKSKHVTISQSTLIFFHYPKPTSTFALCI